MTELPSDEQWYDALYNNALSVLARQEGDAVAEANPRLAYMARKLCEYDSRDPDRLIFGCTADQMPTDAKKHVSFTYMPRPMMQWMAYRVEAECALAAYEAWESRCKDGGITQ